MRLYPALRKTAIVKAQTGSNSKQPANQPKQARSTRSPGKVAPSARAGSVQRKANGSPVRASAGQVVQRSASGASSDNNFNMALGFLPQSSGSGVASGPGVARKAADGAFTSSLAGGTAGANKLSQSAPRSVGDVAQSGFSGSGSEIPHKAQMEQSFGRDFSNVKAYTDSSAKTASKDLGANAYTMGSQVAFKSANPSPSLVAHELTHVIQQTEGPAAHGGASGVGIVTAGEAEADAVEAAVSAGKPASSVLIGEEEDEGIARDGDGSKFTMGMQFSKDGFEKSYEYTIWDKALPPVPTPIPGVFWMFEPGVKVSAKGGANWGGEDAGSVAATVEVSGSFGVGITGGAPGVAELYAVLEPGISGSGSFKKSSDKWSLDVGAALKLGGKIGVKLGGGILDYAFQLFELELVKFTGISWDQDGFHPDKFGLAWGKDIQDILDSINAIIQKAKDAGSAIAETASNVGNAIGNAASDAYEWMTSW